MANLDDIFVTAKNIVTAFNSFTQSNLQLSGNSNTTNTLLAGTTTLVKGTAGRIVTLSVIAPGSTTGSIYDTNATNLLASTNIQAVIPNTSGIYPANLVFTKGIVVTTGTGQTVAITYS
jgi:hypothetical protein